MSSILPSADEENFTGESCFGSFKICTLKGGDYQLDDKLQERKAYFMIVWITGGEGKLSWRGHHFHAVENQLLFRKPGQTVKCTFSDEVTGYIIAFREPFLTIVNDDNELFYANLKQLFSSPRGLTANEDTAYSLTSVMNMMLKETIGAHAFSDDILKRYLKIFLFYISRQQELAEQSKSCMPRSAQIIQDFTEVMNKNYRCQKMVAFYADKLSMTPNYLNEVIKKNTGYSAGHHIRQRVAAEAKQLALHSSIGMKQIAYDLGFDDIAHFSKFFKANSGMSFSTFREHGIKSLQE